MRSMGRDLWLAIRSLRRAPGFAMGVCLTLALGIGANAAVFTLVYELLMRPLPLRQPERVVMIWETAPYLNVERNHVSLPNFSDLRTSAKSIEQMAALTGRSYNLTGQGDPEKLNAFMVTPNLFSVLGVNPMLGRSFREGEDIEGAERVAILSHPLWQRRFGGDVDVIGQTVTLSDLPFSVVGVMPRGFQFPFSGADVWTPAVFPGYLQRARGAHFLMTVARLAEGRTVEQAQAEMTAIMARLAEEYPGSNKDVGAVVIPVREEYSGKLRTPVLVLLGAVGFVLLIACANAGNLLLLRALGRTREMAVRAALGARRGRLLRHFVAESLVLALGGAVLSIVAALWSFELLKQLVPTEIVGSLDLGFGFPALAFTAVSTVVTGLALGLIPAAATLWRRNLLQGLRGGSGDRVLEPRGGLRRLLVLTEVALAFVLLIGAGLMTRTLTNLRGIDPGFRAEGVLTLRTELPRPRYGEIPVREAFYQDVVARARALPGVVDAGFSSFLPLTGSGEMLSFTLEGGNFAFADQPHANCRFVTDGYLNSLGIDLLSGRHFRSSDDAGSPVVAIVNETLARRYWSGENAIGQRYKIGEADSQHPWINVIGVARDVKQESLEGALRPEMYLLHRQAGSAAYFTPYDLSIRTSARPESLATAVRDAIRQVDATVPVTNVRTMNAIVHSATGSRQAAMKLLGCFALLALALASLGIYSVISYSVVARTREIGLRMALGATQREAAVRILRQGLLFVSAGLVLGTVAALALTRLMTTLLYGVPPTDALTFGAVFGIFLAIGALACYLPARRASRIDPMQALRYE